MNVGELKEQIKDLPDNMEVILQEDPEGNGYRNLYIADPNVVIQRYGRQIEVYDDNWTHEDADMEEDEWKALLEKPRVLILAP